MTTHMETLAAAALAAFLVLSFYDGVIVHLWVERLPLRVASRLEHALHTGRAVIFPGLLVGFFGPAGVTTAGLVLLGLDQALEIADMLVERRSRAHTGGLRTSEYVVHGLITTLRAVALILVMMLDGSVPTPHLDVVVRTAFPGSIVIAVVHVLLMMEAGRAVLVRMSGGSMP